MSTRERFPNRRASTIFDFEAMGMRFTASASRYDDGRFAELFLDNHKAGSSIGTLVRDCAIVLSFSLQHGADPPRLVSRQRRPAARPACRCARPAREGAATVSTMPIAAIKIGKRHRHDMGDIEALAADIAGIGMLHPIVVRPDGKLIAGERRLRAAQMLGWKKIAVTVIDLTAVVRGEFAENAHRKDFTLSEAVAIKRALWSRWSGRQQSSARAGALTNIRRNSPEVQKAARSTKWLRSRACTAPPSPRLRPWSMPPPPSRSASQTCSPTWTAPARSTARSSA
jgi:hypothetical protein